MKKKTNEIRFCINKKCLKPLPDGYKHKYCEACRNNHAKAAKNVLKGFVPTVGAALSLVVVVATKGKINPKE